MTITPHLDCKDPFPEGHFPRNRNLTRVTHEGTIVGWFRRIIGTGEGGSDQWQVAVCWEGRIHLGGVADDSDIAGKLMILQIAGLQAEQRDRDNDTGG